MEAPDKLYVVPMKTESQDAFVGLAYELDKLLVGKTEYIRKDALIEWAKYQMSFEQGYSTGEAEQAHRFAMDDLIGKLNSM